uniref:Putative 16.8 kDa salivary protein n=1 Tax=Culex tarsalis TaxID=7177 RepID=A0A1Q3EUW6_CULTA
MIRAILMCLILVLVPVELAKLEPGCVTIKNRYNGKFLTHSNKNHDNDRRHVSLWDSSEKWILSESGDHYRLRHRDLNEELFESEQYHNGNYVFTWIPKRSVVSGEWDILESRTGLFYIKNVKFPHCLSSSILKRWVGAYPECGSNGKNEWAIQAVNC